MEKKNQILSHDNGHCFAISESSKDKEALVDEVLAHYHHALTQSEMQSLGFPVNTDFDYSFLAPFLKFAMNNVGDPFTGSSYPWNSRPFEVSVLDWFAELWEIDKNQYWGYVTSGGTEGNLHGILLGRELFPDGILYTSEDTHDSIFKVARLYRMECVKVGSLFTGEIDCGDLKHSLLAHKDKPTIINLNIGTTMKGAIDDIDLVVQTLNECGFTQDRFYIHCDGALSGIILPLHQGEPKISFKKPIGSITISGHKFIGCPFPCGVLITRLKHINIVTKNVEYISSWDSTITGSRSGHVPIILWYALSKRGLEGLKKEAESCMRKAESCMRKASYLKDQLCCAGISVLLNDFSNTVLFERPRDEGFVRRWNLTSKGNTARVAVMQQVSIETIDAFVRELVSQRSVWYPDGENQPPCLAHDIGAANCACALHK